jgi:hypothetical protein
MRRADGLEFPVEMGLTALVYDKQLISPLICTI